MPSNGEMLRFLQEQQKIAHYIQASGFEHNGAGCWLIEEIPTELGTITKYVCLNSNDDTSTHNEVTDTGYYVEVVTDSDSEAQLSWAIKAFYQLYNFVETSAASLVRDIISAR